MLATSAFAPGDITVDQLMVGNVIKFTLQTYARVFNATLHASMPNQFRKFAHGVSERDAKSLPNSLFCVSLIPVALILKPQSPAYVAGALEKNSARMMSTMLHDCYTHHAQSCNV